MNRVIRILVVVFACVALAGGALAGLVDSGQEFFATTNIVAPFSGTLSWEVFSPGGGYSSLLAATLNGVLVPGYDTDYALLFRLSNDPSSVATVDYNQVAFFNLGTRSFNFVPWEGEMYPGTTQPTGGGVAGGGSGIIYTLPGNGTVRFTFVGGLAPGDTSDVYYFTWPTTRGLDLSETGSWVLEVGDYTTFDVDSTQASEADGAIIILGEGEGEPLIPEPATLMLLGMGVACAVLLMRRR